MESGLEDRNNRLLCLSPQERQASLNGVRPRRPEQSEHESKADAPQQVSMESGLEDRNNLETAELFIHRYKSLNGVRPRRPEQSNA